MSYAIGAAVPFPLVPDWGDVVSESLAWKTDRPTARNGTQQKRQLRQAPRRTLSFSVIDSADNRRLLDAVRFDQGVRPLLQPIYPDLQWLGQDLPTGTDRIACATAGYDFVAGGQALLWQAPNVWEVLAIASVGSDGLALATPTTRDWTEITRLYPLRSGRLTGTPSESMYSDDVSKTTVQMLLDGPCDWPAAWPSDATYRGTPVLEWRPDEADALDNGYDRTTLTVDTDTGPVSYFDLPAMPFRTQAHRWTLYGRAEQARFRALCYALAGMAGQLWVPSWSADLALAAAVRAADVAITVAWCGYTVFGRQQVNRRDLRIELGDGTVLYRRILSSSEAGATELLVLDSALGRDVATADVRQIGYMSVCQLASDTVQIDHQTDADGLAVASTRWQAVKHDL